jgi:30S ribosomal protein S31
MGKGDKRTRRGKIFAGSYGKSRPKYKKKDAVNVKPAETKTEE